MSELKKDSDWMAYLKRYLRITLVYGILMLACTVVGHYLLLPLLLRLPCVIQLQPHFLHPPIECIRL